MIRENKCIAEASLKSTHALARKLIRARASVCVCVCVPRLMVPGNVHPWSAAGITWATFPHPEGPVKVRGKWLTKACRHWPRRRSTRWTASARDCRLWALSVAAEASYSPWASDPGPWHSTRMPSRCTESARGCSSWTSRSPEGLPQKNHILSFSTL